MSATTTSLRREHDTAATSEIAPSFDGTLLLASDGTPAAVAATRIVAELARRWAIRPQVLTVVLPAISLDPVYPTLAPPADIGAVLRRVVARQLAAASTDGAAWPHDVVIGSPSEEIVHAAAAHDARLAVLGLRPHTLLDRVFRDETALSVMRQVGAPVLAVTPSLRAAPRRIAVAVDFSRASIAAARAAVALLPERGELFLVYVEPPAGVRGEEHEGFGVIYSQGLAGAFARLRRDLGAHRDLSIDTVVLQGATAPELLSFARGAAIDLIAVGSQRHSVTRRAFVGSVTTALARAAECSLLVIPPGLRR